ncbi:MAG TPA: SRPBCC family protein [Gemmataceae bacterium]|nr:SRPBCC family protein [Gemmataceae bacterium]
MEQIAHSVSRVYNAITIHRPIAEVFDYVTMPASWVHWHPVTIGVTGVTDHSLHIGEQVIEEIRSVGGKGFMTWTVTERSAPHHWRIDGESNIGINGIISYRFTEHPDGTHYERELYYWKPHGVLYPLVDRIYKRNQVLEESAEALRRIKANLEGGAVLVAGSMGSHGASV